jgi:hypothetical protein
MPHDRANNGKREAARRWGFAKWAHKWRAAGAARPLLIVHLEETRICIDVVCPQKLHHRLHVVGPIVFDIRGQISELAYIDCSGVRGARDVECTSPRSACGQYP